MSSSPLWAKNKNSSSTQLHTRSLSANAKSCCRTDQRLTRQQTEQEASPSRASRCVLDLFLFSFFNTFFLFFRATTSARQPTCPSAGGSVWAALPCPWCTPPTCWTCRRRPPVSWPSTRRTLSTAGPWMTSSYSPTQPAWRVRRTDWWPAGWWGSRAVEGLSW